MPRNTPNPDQASFLSPGMGGKEVITSPDRNFPIVGDDSSPIVMPEARVGVDIPTRSNQLDRALGIMGVLAETLPALEVDHDPGTKFALQKRYGSNYNKEIARSRSIHKANLEKFDGLFEKMWKLDETIETFKDEKPEADIRAEFEEDKTAFQGQFIKTHEHSVEVAQNNRAKMRRKLDKQQRRYQEKNIGVWPANQKRERRIATQVRQETRARQKREAAKATKLNSQQNS